MASSPIQSPLELLHSYGITLPTTGALTLALLVVFAIWAVYTLIAAYHWFKYSHASLVTYPALGMHLIVSFAIMSYALTSAIPYLL